MPPIEPSRTRAVFQRVDKELLELTQDRSEPAVHHFRTSIRRMQAVLELLGQLGEDRDQTWVTRHLDKLRRRAGKVRDLDVQREVLRGLQIGRDAQQKRILLEALEERRRSRERRLARTLAKADVKAIRRHLRRLAAGFTVRGRAGAAQRALAAFARLARTHIPDSEPSLHDFRKRAKKIRYLAELGDDAGARAAAAQLQALQDAIGEWHDWSELTALAEKLLGGEDDCALLAALRNITSAKLTAAWQVLGDTRRTLLSLQLEYRPARRRPPQPVPAAAARRAAMLPGPGNATGRAAASR